jgi:hypothetical protein
MKNRIITILLILSLTIFFAGCQTFEAFNTDDLYGYFNAYYSPAVEISVIDSSIALQEDQYKATKYIVNLVKANNQLINNASYYTLIEGNMVAGNMGYINLKGAAFFIHNDNSWYYRQFIKVRDSKPDVIIPIFQSMLDRGSRHYYDYSDTVRIQETSTSSKICGNGEFPYDSCDFSESTDYSLDIEEVTDYGNNYRSISQFEISDDTISDDTCSVSFNEFYTLVFNLNLDTDAENQVRDMMREISGISNLEYTDVIFTLEVWENGTIKSMTVKENWSGTFNIFLTDLVITSETTSVYYYSYNPDDCDYEILNVDLSWV